MLSRFFICAEYLNNQSYLSHRDADRKRHQRHNETIRHVSLRVVKTGNPGRRNTFRNVTNHTHAEPVLQIGHVRDHRSEYEDDEFGRDRDFHSVLAFFVDYHLHYDERGEADDGTDQLGDVGLADVLEDVVPGEDQTEETGV